jgi:hypothetical protein
VRCTHVTLALHRLSSGASNVSGIYHLHFMAGMQNTSDCMTRVHNE